MSHTYLIPTELETSRLKLRMIEESDWEPLCAYFCDEECVRYTLKTPLTTWQTWRTLAGLVGHWQLRGYGPHAVVEKSSGRTIGHLGLWYPGDWPEPEIGWHLAREFWNKGYATEGATAVRDVAHKILKWNRLISLILPENQASKNVATKLGAIYEKTIPFRDGVGDVFAYDLSRLVK